MPSSTRKSFRECIRHFTWAWHTVIMGTGVLAGLSWNFPYGQGTTVLRVFYMFFFMLNLALFIIVCGMTAARYIMFPEVWGKMLRHPAQSMFMGCFPMGAATLINAGLIANQDWNWGGNGFLYSLWGFWWLDSVVSYAIAFGMIYTMMIRQDHSLSKMTAVWLLPIVSLIVASSSGGNLAGTMRDYNQTIAILTAGFSFTMVVIGLSLACMMLTIYLLRLIVYGPPDISLILSAFIALGPLGQGGYSLLASGEDLSWLLPLHDRGDFPQSPLTGQIIFGVCFCGAYILWSMGICWILIALSCIVNQLRKGRIPFSIAYWGLVFPNGVFAMLTVQLAKVLDSGFFRVFGAFWSVLVFVLWLFNMSQTIPAIIDTSIFKAPYLADPTLGMPNAAPPPPKETNSTSTLPSGNQAEKSV